MSAALASVARRQRTGSHRFHLHVVMPPAVMTVCCAKPPAVRHRTSFGRMSGTAR
ncbi:hypothetical protein [Methylobacterium nodulans]|uniref:hypothetical protein n=1 Tax=Methylobacterium nodulans TaxID=114616 RepID=UPI0002FDA68B|nr:hypothetical protein [Methylobacterium nodulans]